MPDRIHYITCTVLYLHVLMGAVTRPTVMLTSAHGGPTAQGDNVEIRYDVVKPGPMHSPEWKPPAMWQKNNWLILGAEAGLS